MASNVAKYETELMKVPQAAVTPAVAAATPLPYTEPTDELQLSREERKIKRAVEQFDRMESRMRRQDATALDSQATEAELAQFSMSGDGDTARLARMRQRARAKATEEVELESSSSLLDGEDDDDEGEEEA